MYKFGYLVTGFILFFVFLKLFLRKVGVARVSCLVSSKTGEGIGLVRVVGIRLGFIRCF